MNTQTLRSQSSSQSAHPTPEPTRPKRVESFITGTIMAVSKKTVDQLEFIVVDNARNKEFKFRLSGQAAINEKTVDTKKDIITISTSSGKDRFSLIKVGAAATVTTLDPLDSSVPLQALSITINPSLSK